MGSAKLWVGLFTFAIGVLVAGAVAAGWFAYGGLPHGYDKYGVVAIPGAAVVELPDGRVMLDHANNLSPCNSDTSSLIDLPVGTSVRITPVDGGDPLEITSIPAWLYDFSTNCRGHEPFGRIDVPTSGLYVVETTDAANGPIADRAPGDALPTGGADSTSGAGIAFGSAPWTPFGSPLAGAILLFLFGTAISGVPLLLMSPLVPRLLQRLTPRPR